MHLVAQTSVVAFAEFKADVGMHNRVTQSRQDLPVVIHDVAIVQSDDVGLAAGEYVSISHPALAALAIRSDLQAVFFQRAIEALHARPVVPEHADFPGKDADPPLDFLELLPPWPARG